MAYDKNKIFEQCKEAAINNQLLFIEDIIAFIPCNKNTFYTFFPLNSNELNELKELLEENRVNIKTKIRAKLLKSEKSAELLALYRLVCTPEEHRLLNQQYMEQKVNVSLDDANIEFK